MAAGAAGSFGPGWVALGGTDRGCGSRPGVVDPKTHTGEPPVARATRPDRRSGTSTLGVRDARGNGSRVPAALRGSQRATGCAGKFCGDLERSVSRPHTNAGDLQYFSDGGFLWLF